MSLVRVVSYNVLSSHLCAPTHFISCLPEDLAPETRLIRVLNKLKKEVERGSICCLQEVSMPWCGELHTFFERHNYSFIHSLYGSKHSGYMGVGVAFPRTRFDLEATDISRVADTKEWPAAPVRPQPLIAAAAAIFKAARWPMYAAGSSVGCMMLDCVRRVVRWLGMAPDTVKKFPSQPQKCAWVVAQDRANTMVSLRLRAKGGGGVLLGSPENKGIKAGEAKAFTVATYHMPCVFWDPRVMVMHTALSMQHAQRFVEKHGGGESVLAGDFNFEPGSSSYKLVTGGSGEQVNVSDRPPERAWDDWTLDLQYPMRSAYAECEGEPETTNHAETSMGGAFSGTLDYVWVSPGVKVLSCLELPIRADLGKALPNAEQPSDHLLIAADLRL